ncbi:hypothetical protein [Desulfotalea psychrophila]|uniref:hypothetical protein n=1 Tax=Desulfotalea psychrophila TaxID=84980 RepID=UPI0002E173D3|nr:hypothetical protein [Desulfotalea psychrophila]
MIHPDQFSKLLKEKGINVQKVGGVVYLCGYTLSGEFLESVGKGVWGRWFACSA